MKGLGSFFKRLFDDTKMWGSDLVNDLKSPKDDILNQLGLGSLTFNNIKVALVLLVVCVIFIKIVLHLLNRFLKKSKIDKSLHTFIRTLAKVTLYFMAVLIVTKKLGVGDTFLAVFGILGGALALSSKDLLSNVFGGFNLLITRPFNVDDFVEAESTIGQVVDIGVVYTKINTGDNVIVFIPNGKLVGGKITNYSVKSLRKVEVMVSASYEDSIDKVKQVIGKAIEENSLILKDKEISVRIKEYKDSSVSYLVQVWAKNADYKEVYFGLLEGIKVHFDKNGISMPYNQLDVKIKEK